MRQVALDTETTGLDPALGDRIIEIGLVEIVDRVITGRSLVRRARPDFPIHPMATKVHGITNEDLELELPFEASIGTVIDFIGGDELIAHNAPFDMKFLNAELVRAGYLPHAGPVVDTMRMAGLQVGGSLNALCKRYGIDLAGRELHGALLDAQLCARCYIELTRGQDALALDSPEGTASPVAARPEGLVIPVPRATPAELEAHRSMMLEIQERKCGT